MPSLREIRGHIRSVTGIAQVIHAMEAVSSVKTHRLQERVEHSRAYADTAWRMLARVSGADDPAVQSSLAYGTGRDGDHTCLVLMSSNRGMAGGFDQNVLRAALKFAELVQDGVEFVTIGSKGHDALLHRGLPVVADWSQLNEHVQMEDISPIASYLMRGYREGAFERAAIAYSQFHEGARMRPTVRPLLPVTLGDRLRQRQFYFEPGAAELIEMLLPRVVLSTVHLALLESMAAENASRAVAMRSAGKNARELVDHLRLSYNKSRQQAITAEMNIASSALPAELGS
jgi:F-type H+-transporting ATPase subunit gamma